MMIAYSTTLKAGGGRGRGLPLRSLFSVSLLLLLLLGLISRCRSDDTDTDTDTDTIIAQSESESAAQRQYVFVKIESIGDVRPAEASVDDVLLIINNDEGKLNALSAQTSSFYYEKTTNNELLDDSTLRTSTSSYTDIYGRSPGWSIFNNADTGGTTFMETYGTLRVRSPLDSMSDHADIYGDREGIWIKTTESYEANTIKALELSLSLRFGRGYNNTDRYYKMQVGVGVKEDDFSTFQVLAEVIVAPTITTTSAIERGYTDDWRIYTAKWDIDDSSSSSNAMEGGIHSELLCPIPPVAATTFIITGSTIRADNGEQPEWFELAEIKLFTADGTNVAPDASYEFLVDPSNYFQVDKDVLVDGEIFDETSGRFVTWNPEQVFRGEDLVQITFDSPVKIVGVELYSTNYESFGTDCVVASVDETTGRNIPLPLRIVYDAHPNQNKAYAHCFENGVESAVGTNCSTMNGADPPFRNCSVEKENAHSDSDSNTVLVDTGIIDGAVAVAAAAAADTTTFNAAEESSSSSSSTYSVAIVAASTSVVIIIMTTTTMMAF